MGFLFAKPSPSRPPPPDTKPVLDDDEMDALAMMLGNPCAGKKITDTLPEFRLPDENKSSADASDK